MVSEEESAEPPRRKLTTILAADVVGYSRMMGEDENGTHARLLRSRKIIDGNIGRRGGRIFNTAGDSVMAEFSSTVEAVRCAIEIQEEFLAHNTDAPSAEQMWFRIGLNVGDVIIEGEDLIGDGVNIASRMESIAARGGICISGSVYELVHNKLSFAFQDMGKQSVKNIVSPVPAYRLLPVAPTRIDSPDNAIVGATTTKRRLRSPVVSTALVFTIIALIAAAYFASKKAAIDQGVVPGKAPLAPRPDRDVGPSPAPAVPSKPLEVKQPMTVRKRDTAPEADAPRRREPQPPPTVTPPYFEGKSVEGITEKTGERFVIDMTDRGTALVTLYKRGVPDEARWTETGRWWVNKRDHLCFSFENFAKGKKFCRALARDGDREFLIGGTPTKPKWDLKPKPSP